MPFVEGADGALTPAEIAKFLLRGLNIVCGSMEDGTVVVKIQGSKGSAGVTIPWLANGAGIEQANTGLKLADDGIVSVPKKKPIDGCRIPVHWYGIRRIKAAILRICGRPVHKPESLLPQVKSM